MSLEKFEKRITEKKSQTSTILDYDIFPIPLGAIVEIRSQESELEIGFDLSKKFQSEVFWLDGNHSIDWHFYREMGGDLSKILSVHPDSPKEYFRILHKLLSNNEIRIIICNNALTMYPQDEDYQWFIDKMIELQALVRYSKKIVIILNPYATGRYQLIDKYSDVIIEFKKHEGIKRGEKRVGYYLEGAVTKTKFFLPTDKFNCKLLYEKGLEKC